jgi:hypothetical protein
MGAAPRRAQQATDTGRGLAVQGISYAKLANLPPIIGLCEFSFFILAANRQRIFFDSSVI